MGHGKEQYDEMVGLEPFWHKLNKVVDEITLANSGQAWGIKGVPMGDYSFLPQLQAALKKGNLKKAQDILAEVRPLDGWKIFKCSDNDLTVHVAKETYTPIQPERIWQVIGNSLSSIKHRIVSAGTYGNRAKLFVSVEILDGRKFAVEGQEYQNYLNFLLGNDGTLGLNIHDNSFKVVCKNTFNASLAMNHNFQAVVMHTEKNEEKIQDVEKQIDAIYSDRDRVYEKLAELEAAACDTERAEKIFTGFLLPEVEKPSTRTKNQVKRLSELFGDARRGNFAKSLRNVFEAGTDYFTHESSGGENLWRQVNSSEIGNGRIAKVELFKTLTTPERLEQTVKRGEEILSIKA